MRRSLLGEVLPTQSLTEFLGDEELIPQSPEELSITGPLRFQGKFSPRLLIVVFLIWIMLVLVVPLKLPNLPSQWVYILSSAFVVAILILPLMRCRWSITLHEGGVDFESYQCTIHIPWQTLDSTGWPLYDQYYQRLTLPLNSDHSGSIEKKDGDEVRSRGAPMRTCQVSLEEASRIIIKGYYRIDLVELGNLMLIFGASPKGSLDTLTVASKLNSPSAKHTEQKVASGWRKVDFMRDHLPAICCGCGDPCVQFMNFPTEAWYIGLVQLASHVHIESRINLPICPRCRNRFRRRRWLLYMILIGIGIGFLALSMVQSSVATYFLPIGILALLVTLVVGRTRLAGVPAQIRKYSRARGTFELWTRFQEFQIVRYSSQDT